MAVDDVSKARLDEVEGTLRGEADRVHDPVEVRHVLLHPVGQGREVVVVGDVELDHRRGVGEPPCDGVVIFMVRPNEVSTTSAPCSWACLAMWKAMEESMRTPVTSSFLPSSNMGGTFRWGVGGARAGWRADGEGQ